VTVRVTGAGNALSALTFGNGPRVPTNALIDLPDGRTGLTGTPSYAPPAGSTQTTFWVRRQAAGAPVQVPFVVADGCGDWPTFVGGGTGQSAAGF
jgi:hypothetical protein